MSAMDYAVFTIGIALGIGYAVIADEDPTAPKVAVLRVIDGDTLEVKDPTEGKVKVRILGIDCPESKKNQKCNREGKTGGKSCAQQIPKGKLALEEAKSIIGEQKVGLECDGNCKNDLYDRELRYVRLDNGVDFGLHMVRRGFCMHYGAKYPHPRKASYKEAEDLAKKEKLGIWK
jgi:micrococcal nuclease